MQNRSIDTLIRKATLSDNNIFLVSHKSDAKFCACGIKGGDGGMGVKEYTLRTEECEYKEGKVRETGSTFIRPSGEIRDLRPIAEFTDNI